MKNVISVGANCLREVAFVTRESCGTSTPDDEHDHFGYRECYHALLTPTICYLLTGSILPFSIVSDNRVSSAKCNIVSGVACVKEEVSSLGVSEWRRCS